MSEKGLVFPSRPLTARPPGTGLASSLWSILVAVLVLGGFVVITVPPIPDLLADWSIRKTAQPSPNSQIAEGECKTHLVLVTCNATLTLYRPGQPKLEHETTIYFVDLHTGDYSAMVMADPARPEYLTTDLALETFWNRAITLGLSIPLFALLAWGMLRYGFGRLREGRRLRAALRDKPMRPTMLRLEGRGPKGWAVAGVDHNGAPVRRVWAVPRRAKPVVLDADKGLILGVTVDGSVAMPLDAKLRWVDFTKQEREALSNSLTA
ncbi:hypothetical protein D3874_09140 [Oleomonas cavernae]|uniref:Uncharacterized protein n=1 Tax=Oleomonas cavernae TaxID=2320859 RepID=A0A418WAY9_9PROT|nr:hypothetical protein [Oleomonas cavernae]RJF87170.1 hypothetical protein D3874_09140 [Oleomonas cavernae]